MPTMYPLVSACNFTHIDAINMRPCIGMYCGYLNMTSRSNLCDTGPGNVGYSPNSCHVHRNQDEYSINKIPYKMRLPFILFISILFPLFYSASSQLLSYKYTNKTLTFFQLGFTLSTSWNIASATGVRLEVEAADHGSGFSGEINYD